MKNSLSPQQEKLEQLKQLLPEVFTEGRVDWEKLKLSLGEDINIKNERYILNWAGKSNAYKVLQEPTSKTLSPDKNESVDFDKTENLFIEGDNLEALKILQKSYFGKVKMIYIDPPYNTGNDSFIYPDRFKENLGDYQKNVGDKDDEGYLIQDSTFRKNRKENGQHHSNWLNMMMPRVYLAKNLLRDDGVIFISIDDNEVYNLRLLMNEIFGEENFVALLPTIMNLKGNNDEFGFSGTHEYLIVYAKFLSTLKDLKGLNSFPLSREEISEYNLKDDKGFYKQGATLMRTGEAGARHHRPKGYYPIYVSPKFDRMSLSKITNDDWEVYPKTVNGEDMSWRRSPETLRKSLDEFIIKQTKDGISFYKKQRLEDDLKLGQKPKSLFYKSEYSSGNGTAQIKDIFNGKIFSNPKPLALIKDIMTIGSAKDSIILDFFAGSGTTAHAVMQLNAEDDGHRKCISIQLPEICEENSEAFKAGYKTIADIAKERIRRAGKKIKEDNKNKENIDQLDIGFKVLKVSNSNFKEWRTDISSEELDQQLNLHVDPIAEDASTENMVYELMLKNGKDLNSHIKHHNNIYSISDQENHNKNILILLLEEVNEGIIENVLQQNPNKVIALDKLFKNNDQLKTNTALQMQDADIKFETI
ncbi:site-specific DNA-methyltransferase [Commensalibacter sp. A3DC]|uniref:site-specific DNA-methyltransferase n=1 Tax=Commensalibacter sp. A3DC TaxID=3093920 RepID=UPI0039B66A58